MIKTGVINGTNYNRDSDFQALISELATAGVKKGYSTECEVQANLLKAGICFVEVTRTTVTPNEIFKVPVQITTDEIIDTSGTGFVIIKGDDAKINDGSLNSDDGSLIFTVEVVASLPTVNFLELATLTGGAITDTRTYAVISDNAKSEITKADVGLDQVDNTSDLNKPVSISTALELAGKQGSAVPFTLEKDATAKDIMQLLPNGNVEAVISTIGEINSTGQIGESDIAQDETTPNVFLHTYRDSTAPYNQMFRIGTVNEKLGVSYGASIDSGLIALSSISLKQNPSITGQFLMSYYSGEAGNLYTGLIVMNINGVGIDFELPIVVSNIGLQNTNNKTSLCINKSNKIIVNCLNNEITVSGNNEPIAYLYSLSINSLTFIDKNHYFNLYSAGNVSCEFNSNNDNQAVLGFMDFNGSDYLLKAVVCSIDTNILLFGAISLIETGVAFTSGFDITADTNNTNSFMIGYNDDNSSLKSCLISGTGLLIGTGVVIPLNDTTNTPIYKNESGEGYFVSGYLSTIKITNIAFSGNTITVGTQKSLTIPNNPSFSNNKSVYQKSTGLLIIVAATSTIVLTDTVGTNLDGTKIIGALLEDGIATESKNVVIKGGIVGGYSGMTQLTDQYVNEAGEITESTSSPNVKIGTSINDTTIALTPFI